MDGYSRESTDAKILRTNQGIIESYVDAGHYVREFAPQSIQLGAGPPVRAVLGSTAVQWPSVNLPNAQTSQIHGSLVRPDFWLNGNLSIRLHYTSGAASAALYNISLRVWTVTALGTLLNSAVFAVSPTVPGPANAQDELEYYVAPAGAINASVRRISWRVDRDGVGDANNNDFHVLAVVLRHIPAAGH